MLSRLINNSTQDQFLKIYNDASHSTLFGWLYTFADPDNPNITIELWALVNPADVGLSGICIYPVVEPALGLIPGDFKTWLRFLSTGPQFGAFIYSASYMIPSSFDQPGFEGSVVAGIYNQGIQGDGRALVSVSLQTTPEILDAQTTTFDQILQMSTLDAQQPAFLYPPLLPLRTAITPQTFIENGGVPGMEPAEVEVIMYEKMLTKVCKLMELVPEDFYLFVNS
ncbi:hypothetical protein SAMN05428988_0767 [Chitinophaga sp. YR573]|uniref:hypothetical protein n=1 Tax=Chitinophaga sp. YR573 TaxID=1881040 RepID=UPI0008D2788A|nr:hypothetical protein [Chitinophaga sp. YR573]SEV95539.1 hypothetical protein SAMN05428988_0767 [Chitinophaga sp. YR573]